MAVVHVQRRRDAAGRARDVRDPDLVHVDEERDAQAGPVGEHLARADIGVPAGRPPSSGGSNESNLGCSPRMYAANPPPGAWKLRYRSSASLAFRKPCTTSGGASASVPARSTRSVRSGPTKTVSSPSST